MNSFFVFGYRDGKLLALSRSIKEVKDIENNSLLVSTLSKDEKSRHEYTILKSDLDTILREDLAGYRSTREGPYLRKLEGPDYGLWFSRSDLFFERFLISKNETIGD